MKRRMAIALLTLGMMAFAGAGGAAADDFPGSGNVANQFHVAANNQNYWALGLGSFSAAGSPFTNYFIFGAATPTNGSGGDGGLAVVDFQNRVYYAAQVTCVYVDPATRDATIWGRITVAHTASAVVGGSVLLNVSPGTSRSTPPAGFGNYLFYGAPPTTCSAVTRPEADPIKTGAIATGVPTP